jgi:hypothetical protein
MTSPLPSLLSRMSYGARQMPRLTWYVGHSLALRRLSEATRRQEGKKARHQPHTDLPVPDRPKFEETDDSEPRLERVRETPLRLVASW